MFTHRTLAAGAIFVLFGAACKRDTQPAVAGAADTVAKPMIPAGTPTNLAVVVHRYPHDATAFTEGLEWHDGSLYEGTGIVGQSGVRRTELATGALLKYLTLAPPHFGEGVTVYHGTLYELTWKDGVGFKYDAATFAPRGQFHYTGEGWGLTHDAHSLIMSDGTSVLRYLDPGTFKVQRTLAVSADGMSVPRLNELELIHGELWANLWQSSNIARIDPATGKVIAWVDLSPLTTQIAAGDTVDVANGIAYDSVTDRIFVTGKLWSSVYEIRLGPRE
jgi:glutaminyl-peptide cyclotransferase